MGLRFEPRTCHSQSIMLLHGFTGGTPPNPHPRCLLNPRAHNFCSLQHSSTAPPPGGGAGEGLSYELLTHAEHTGTPQTCHLFLGTPGVEHVEHPAPLPFHGVHMTESTSRSGPPCPDKTKQNKNYENSEKIALDMIEFKMVEKS